MFIKRLTIPILFAPALGFLTSTGNLHALTFRVVASASGQGVTSGDVLNHAGEISVSESGSDFFGTGSASSYASATVGVVKAQVQASATATLKQSPADTHTHVATAISAIEANFVDSFTIDSPGLRGKAGAGTISLYIPHTLQFSAPDGGPSLAGYSAELILLGGAIASDPTVFRDVFGRNADTGPNLPTDGKVTVDFDFVYGMPITIGLHLDLDAQIKVQEGASGSADLDFAHSFYWGGLSSISYNKAPLAADQFSVTSPSGNDYYRSYYVPAEVPDTGSSGLLLANAAFCLIALRPLINQMFESC